MSALAMPKPRLPAVTLPCARDLCITVPDVSPATDNAAVLALFNRHEDLVSLPVVENGRPIGLINRHLFLSQMSRQYYRELYDRKSCVTFMNKHPQLIDAATPLSEVAERAVQRGDKFLSDGFIITERGDYRGIGLGIDLLKIVSNMHARQHQQIVQSIEYASVIQSAMLNTSRQAMATALADWCLVWEPRDCVGGDCYYFRPNPQGWLAVVADCTGHGVPGAFMTLIFNSALEQALAQHGPRHPAQLLAAINRHIKDTLGQVARDEPQGGSNDGCDALLLFADTAGGELRWASARLPAYCVGAQGVGAQEVQTLAGDRMGVGYTDTPYDYCWQEHRRPLTPREVLFTATDGLTDQIGGERRIMFGKRRLHELLQRYRHLPMPELAAQLRQQHGLWQGGQSRRDDLTFWGFRA